MRSVSENRRRRARDADHADQVAGAQETSLLQVGQVGDAPALFQKILIRDVAHETDDLETRRVLTPQEIAPDWRFVPEELSRQRSVDDDDRRRAFAVARCEVSPREERHANRRKVFGRDGIEVGPVGRIDSFRTAIGCKRGPPRSLFVADRRLEGQAGRLHPGRVAKAPQQLAVVGPQVCHFFHVGGTPLRCAYRRHRVEANHPQVLADEADVGCQELRQISHEERRAGE